MDKRTETAFVLDNNGNHTNKHVFVWPGHGIYRPANDSWVFVDDKVEEPERLYSYAGGTVLLPWKLENGKWIPDLALSIVSDGMAVDPKIIEGEPKESIRLIGHYGNAILVIGWPDSGDFTIYIFDRFGRFLTTGIHSWSLGNEPAFPFCTGISNPVLKDSPKSIELTIAKSNKTSTSVTIGLPTTKKPFEKLPLLVFSI